MEKKRNGMERKTIEKILEIVIEHLIIKGFSKKEIEQFLEDIIKSTRRGDKI